MFLLDTDITTLAFHVRPAVVVRLEILRGRIEAVLKAATADEVLRAQAGLTKSEAFLARFVVVPVADDAARRFERLRADKKLKRTGPRDLLIACIALAHGATLVTRNTKDFSLVPGLKLENWAD